MISKEQLAAGMKKGFEKWNHRYATEDGTVYMAQRMDDIKRQMRELGWKNIARLEESDFERAGFKVIYATYTSGARPTGKYIKVLTLGKVVTDDCTYPDCKCIVSTSTSHPEPVCPKQTTPGLARMKTNLGPEKAEALRQQVLADQRRALGNVRPATRGPADKARDHASPVKER